jgi:hypothetical protein
MMPPISYYGGKTRIAGRIAALLPAHGHYVEPFAGSLAVLLSGYASPLYEALYDGWHRHEIRVHAGNGTGDKTRTEVLWSNRPLAAAFPLFEDGGAP